MSFPKRTVKLASLVFAGLIASLSGTLACSCLNDTRPTGMDLMTHRFSKAENVVRGKITSMRAGSDIQLNGLRVVKGTMRIDETLKGQLKGELEILTGFGVGDCGGAEALLISIAWDRQLELEITTDPAQPNLYSISSCGYAKLLPSPSAIPSTRN